MYCGDETGAVIGDIGSHTSRFGYGGEDCPKVVISSAAYRHVKDDHVTGNSEGKRQKVKRAKYSAPVSLLNLPPDDCFSGDEVGFIPVYSLNSNQHKPTNTDVDLEAYAALWEYSFQSLSVRGRKKHTIGSHHEDAPADGQIDHPILSSRDPHHGQNEHASMLEILFETLSAPAAYLAPGATLSAFSFGRQTALVVDVGHSSTHVTPVIDGYALKFGSVISERGGAWLGRAQEKILSCDNLWRDLPCSEVVPRYILRSKDVELQKLKLLKASSFHRLTVHQVMFEMMTGSHVFPLEEESSYVSNLFSGKENEANNTMEEDEDEEDVPVYVLPDGTRVDIGSTKTGKDLCHLPVSLSIFLYIFHNKLLMHHCFPLETQELFFSDSLPSFLQTYSNSSADTTSSITVLPLHKLVQHSLSEILDVDIRKELISNIILTGSASLFAGMDKRLSYELTSILPNMYKNRVICSKNSIENRYSTWIGGSILSSLGSFQQMWLSKREYDECGALLGLRKFH
jgi:actin-related protein